MTGDTENEFGPADDAAVPETPQEPDLGGGESPRPKAFRNWGAAKKDDSGPSLLRRASDKFKSLFGSKGGEPETADESLTPSGVFVPGVDRPDAGEAPEGPSEDLQFLHLPSDEPDATATSEPVADIVAEPALELTSQLEESESLVPEISELAPVPVLDVPEEKPKRGLFSRLFAPKSSSKQPETPPEPTDVEVPVETIAEGVDVAALDEALPMDPPAETMAEMPLDVVPDTPPPAKKGGFFARLMGRSQDAPPPAIEEPAAEPADVTANLDAADAAFASATDESFVPPEPTPDAAFASVEDALPVEETPAPAFEATMAEQPIFNMPVYDFEKASREDAAPPVEDEVSDARSTLEVDLPSVEAVDSRPTAEVDMAAELDRKTDEFEIVLDETLIEPPADEEKTAEVPKAATFFGRLFGKTKETTQVEPAVAPPPTANPTFLVTKFRTFYNEVVVYKNQKAEFTGGFATAIVTDYTADLSPEQASESLATRLQQMLELQTAEASWMGGECAELYPEAQYAMATLADEMLTFMEWPGQGAWQRHRLELKLFKSAGSDVDFFKRVDKLLKNGPQTVGTRDLARVYLLAIASGFQGKYRPFKLTRPLAEYRRRLFEFVYDGDPLMLYADERRIFPEAVSQTLIGKAVSRFTMAQRWAAVLILLLTGYTILSHVAWNKVSADLRDMTGRVEQARTANVAAPNGGGGR